ncbi:MAG: hypothetical protein ACE5F4_00060 [Candidatus Paceibacteria bacterium]
MQRTFILSFIALILVAIVAFFVFVFVPGTSEPQGDTGGNQGLFGSLFPFNSGGGDRVPAEGGPGDSGDELVDTRPVPDLRQVTETPSSGGFFYENEADETVIRFIERRTGHVYDTPAEGRSVVRISNTTIPGIQEVLFANKDAFIIRSLDKDGAWENFYATLEGDTAEQSLSGSFLAGWERGVLDAAGENLLTVNEGVDGSSVVLSGSDGSGARRVLSSPVVSWIPLQSDDNLYVYTAPSSGIPGFLYRVVSGALRRVAGDVPGMMALVSPSGRYVLLSTGPASGEPALILLDTETGEESASPLGTLASKCVFLSESPVRAVCGVPQEFPEGAYPDDWLRGTVSFDDDIWLVEPERGTATLLALPDEDVGVAIDAWRPFVSESGAYVGFLNKKDLSLWSLRLQEEVF